MKLELSGETLRALYRDVLFEDYLTLKWAIKDLKSKKPLMPYQKEDLDADKAYLKAVEKVLEYQIGHNWREVLGVDDV